MGTATAVKERPIIFSSPMVNAILDGRKTMTRRICRNSKVRGPYEIQKADRVVRYEPAGLPPEWSFRRPVEDPTPTMPDAVKSLGLLRCPYGVPGDRLWCRESFSDPYPLDVECRNFTGFFRATDPDRKVKWKPSIHMPRWASRLLLEITDVRVERLREITPADARAEGVDCPDDQREHNYWGGHLIAFRELWNSINGPRGFGWDASPWVWVVTFKRLEAA